MKEVNGPKKRYVAMKSCFALFSAKVRDHIGKAKMLRCVSFKQLRDEQIVDKLPSSQGGWIEHIRRANAQANIDPLYMVLNPTCLDPLTLEMAIQTASGGSFSGWSLVSVL